MDASPDMDAIFEASDAKGFSANSMMADAEAIVRLARLDVLTYERCREAEAKALGIRVAVLDLEVEAQRRSSRARLADDEAIPPDGTDEALALKFADEHAGSLRYVAAWGKWLSFSGVNWETDKTLATFNLARAICRNASASCSDVRIAARVASAATVAATEKLARADRRHAATVEQWDADDWLLNTPGGVVDLRTGKMHRHDPERYCTKVTAVAPGADCPHFLAFLKRATNQDDKLQAYWQRVAGYSLTGSTREHALFFGYGTGANGKSVLIGTLTGLMGTYATTAPIETFTATQSDRHPTDLAMLRGARLVTAQETEEGRSWAESRIKALTGGDPVTARFMRQDFFTFQPAFKLLIAGNHRPALRNVDEAIRRRFNLIPFSVRIPAAERDHDLPEKLKAEWPGILKWAIEGCLAWRKDGLQPPKAVVDATAEYLEAEDALATWLSERCVQDKRAGTTLLSSASLLFGDWRSWAETAAEEAGSQKRFSQALLTRGFLPERLASGKAGFRGLSLAAESSAKNRYGE